MTAPTASQVLSYSRQPRPTNARARALRLLLALPALVLPFIEIACDTTPAQMAFGGGVSGDELLLMAIGWGFFVGWLAFAWRAVTILRPSPGRRIMLAGAVAAPLAWIPVVATIAVHSARTLGAFLDGRTGRELIFDALPASGAATVATAGLLFAWRLRRAGDAPAALCAALTTAFLANAAFCLLTFYPGDEIGYYVTAYLALLWAGEELAAALRLRRG